MFSEITSYLQLKEISENKFICVTKDATCDLNFIFCEILSHYIKNDYFVVFLNFAQSFSHYNHLLQKSGVNIRLLRDNQNVVFIDGLCETEKLTDFEINASEQNSSFSTLFSNSESMKQLFLCVKNHADNCIEKSKRFVIFIDEISLLLNLGLEKKAICSFVQYCRSLCIDSCDKPNILLIGSTKETLDKENSTMVNYFLHLADVRIEVEGLRTGHSKDAHGKMILSTKNGIEGITHHNQVLFKVTEKGAKLFTLGL